MENEQKNYLLITSCCFLIGCLISYLLVNLIKANYSYGEFTASKRVITSDNTGGRTDTTGTILKTGTTSKAVRTSKSTKETDKRGTELILDESSKSSLNPIWAVGGGWLGENEYERVINKLIEIGVKEENSKHLAWECYRQTADGKLCVENFIGVSSSESSILQHCSEGNNCMGVMVRQKDGSYRLKEYATINYGISDWVSMYQRFERYKRTTAQAWLNGHYCTSECSYWIGNYNHAVNLLGF